MEINFQPEFKIAVDNPELKTILKVFTNIIPIILNGLMESIVLEFAKAYMKQEVKPFCCDICGNNTEFIWKTMHGKKTSFITIFKTVFMNQLQVKCKKCEHRFYITRKLLGLEPKQRIPIETKRKLGLIGALASFRVSEKIAGIFGCVLNRMLVWRSVQEAAKEIEFDLDPDELPHAEADGTGIPIQGIKKRGKEMKVVVQMKKGGGVRIAGLSIGNYDKGWDKLFNPLKKTIRNFENFLLVTDGDISILKGLGKKLKIVFQRCLWHIPHQMKYCLWKDKVKRKSEKWYYALSEIFDICAIKYGIDDDNIIEKIIKSKTERLDKLINYCIDNKFKSTASYLTNAKPDMFSAFSKKLKGKTTSKVERVMRTINLRINVGKWNTNGSLNAAKIRLAYYYNGYNVDP